jgi:hypothetical protein
VLVSQIGYDRKAKPEAAMFAGAGTVALAKASKREEEIQGQYQRPLAH